MSLRHLLTIGAAIVTLGWVGAQDYRAPVEFELHLEGGLDLRRGYDDGVDHVMPPPPYVISDGDRQAPAPYAAASAMRRISGLRAFYGLRIEGHRGVIARERTEDSEARHATISAMIAYRAFFADIDGDCDCPTWGNDPWLKKAVFFEVGLGAGWQRFSDIAPAALADGRYALAYLARIGLSHRLTRAVDVYAAAGLHGLLGESIGFRVNHLGLRPALGLTWRPGR